MALVTPTGLEVREYSNNPDQPHTSAFLAALAAHPHIRAKPCGGGVTAYNFTRTAFKRGLWDEKTVTARGLFVRDGQVVGRGFDKFFNLGEHGESLDRLAYPVTAAEKVNGFLGIAFVLDGKMVVWSKSGPTDYAAAAQDAFERQIAGNQRERLADLMAGENVSLALEIVIDSDPHLVPSSGVAEVTLLSVIANDEHFRTRPDLLDKICLPQAETLGVARDRAQLDRLVRSVRSRDGEGAVLTDATGHMVKIKTDWYLRRRKVRTALTRLWRGITTSLPQQFADIESFLKTTGRWGRLDEFAVTTPSGKATLDIPRLLDGLD